METLRLKYLNKIDFLSISKDHKQNEKFNRNRRDKSKSKQNKNKINLLVGSVLVKKY